MLKSILLPIAALLILSICLVSCEKDSANIPHIEVKTHQSELPPLNDRLELPEGTIISQSDEGMSFNLPNGYELFSSERPTLGFTFGEVECNCESNDGSCQPFYASQRKIGKILGCFTKLEDPCSDCRMTLKAGSLVVGGDIQLRKKKQEPNPFCFVPNTDIDLMALTCGEQISKVPMATSLDFDNPSFARAAKDLIDWIYPEGIIGEQLEQNQMLYPFAIQGKMVMMEMPRNYDYHQMDLNPDAAFTFEEGRINCKGCHGSCRHVIKQLILHFCEGCNSGCILRF